MILKQLISFLALFCASFSLIAKPAITFQVQPGATTMLSQQEEGAINYLLTLDKKVPGTLNNLQISALPVGVSSISNRVSSCAATTTVCTVPFNLSPGGQCCLMLHLNGAQMIPGQHILAPVVSTTPPAYSFKAPPVTVQVKDSTLSTKENFALSVQGLTLYGADPNQQASGRPRTLKVTNQSDVPVSGVSVQYPQWPTGTYVSSDSCSKGTIPAHGSCSITIVPGTQATSQCTKGISPTPGIITISAQGLTSVQSRVVILGYGCIYQDGYLFSIDEPGDLSQRIGGKVLSLSDQSVDSSNGIVWDSTAGCVGENYDQCIQTNAHYIITAGNPTLNNPYLIHEAITQADSGVVKNSYANDLCWNYQSPNYAGWYLPAICEMGYGANDEGVDCGTQTNPLVQNIQLNLVDSQILSGLIGQYWSSTESKLSPTANAWYQFFYSNNSSGSSGSAQYPTLKNNLLGVRCVRILS